MIGSDDYAVVEFIGRAVEIPFCDVHRIDDGKITKLGLLPEAAARATS